MDGNANEERRTKSEEMEMDTLGDKMAREIGVGRVSSFKVMLRGLFSFIWPDGAKVWSSS